MKMSKTSVLMFAGVVLAILAVVAFLVLNGDTMLGLDSSLKNTVIALMPGGVLLIAGLGVMVKARGVVAVAAGGFTGIAAAYLLGALNGLSMLSPEMMSGLTLVQIQAWAVLMGIIVGGIVTAASR